MLSRLLRWARSTPKVQASDAVEESARSLDQPVAAASAPSPSDLAACEHSSEAEADTAATAADAEISYDARMAAEIATFADQINVHDLPEMFHYWSNTYLRPMTESLGYSYPEDFFAKEIARARASADRPIRVISLGAGNGDTEVRVAQLLRERGVDGVAIECMDINPAMLARCAEHAAGADLSPVVIPVKGDFNRWVPDGSYDVVMANQSLHHVLELEHLFDAIHAAIGADGVFLTADMIGRNGHMRWPEAMAEVQKFWQELPEQKRYNVQLKRMETEFMDWDCSVEGFEGVRAQDILPLLVERFAFDTFIAWGNIIDIFIDRSFGHHLNANDPKDRDFVDRLHARDEEGLLAGEWKPTHIMAVMKREVSAPTRQWRHLSPEFCVRPVPQKLA
jgi:SAM-dependent methyltransferase